MVAFGKLQDEPLTHPLQKELEKLACSAWRWLHDEATGSTILLTRAGLWVEFSRHTIMPYGVNGDTWPSIAEAMAEVARSACRGQVILTLTRTIRGEATSYTCTWSID